MLCAHNTCKSIAQVICDVSQYTASECIPHAAHTSNRPGHWARVCIAQVSQHNMVICTGSAAADLDTTQVYYDQCSVSSRPCTQETTIMPHKIGKAQVPPPSHLNIQTMKHTDSITCHTHMTLRCSNRSCIALLDIPCLLPTTGNDS